MYSFYKFLYKNGYIDSDPALSSQFKGGFRVVSFQKKSGKNAWNA